MDFISSLVVLWRFYCPHGCDEAKLAKLQKREERASVAISMVIGVLGIFVFGVGIADLMHRDEDTDLTLLFTISFLSIIVFGTLAIIKFKYANDLDSPSLRGDGICSLIGTCLSASLLLTTSIIDRAPGAWVLDPIVSLLIGLSATVYGFHRIIKMIMNGIPVYHRDYWIAKKEVPTQNQELPEVEKGEGDYKRDKEADEVKVNSNENEHEVI